MNLREAAQQALEALKSVQDHRPNDETNNAVTNLRAALAQQAEPVLQTCNCRWDGEVQVQQCTLHEAHIDAIHEWAERVKVAERKLAQQAEPHRDLREHMAEVQRLRAALAQPATIAEWWAAKQAASEEPVAQYSDIVSDGGFDPRNAAPQPAPARVPLDEQIMATLIARAIEATHGITTKEAP